MRLLSFLVAALLAAPAAAQYVAPPANAGAGAQGADPGSRCAGAAGVARGLLAWRCQPARVSRALDAVARRNAHRREPDGHAGQDAGLRISASRVARRRRPLRRLAIGQGGDRVPARKSRPWTSRGTGTTRFSRSSIPGRNFRSGSSIVARRTVGCTRRWKGRSAVPTGRSPTRCAGSIANRANSSAK